MTLQISRRGFLRLSAAAAAVGALYPALPALAQMPPPEGPIVWGGMTQNQLDAAYDQNFWDNDPPETGQRSTANGDAVRARYGEPQRIQYGPSQFEFLDLYRSKARHAPVMVFIHGGAWRGGSARGAAQNAEMFMLAGAHFISLEFVNVLQTTPLGDLRAMVTQVRRGVAWVYNNAHRFGGDRRRLFISGHSSGGHLGGCVMTTDWGREHSLPWDTVKGGVLISGMYDLYPVSLSARRLYVNFTPDVVEDLSAQRHLDLLNAPIVVAHGTKESPEFMRQSRDFVAAVRAAGKPVEYVIGTGYNHFEIPETLGNPYGVVGRAALALMDLPVTMAGRGRGRRDKDDDD
jgi:arylformamidase